MEARRCLLLVVPQSQQHFLACPFRPEWVCLATKHETATAFTEVRRKHFLNHCWKGIGDSALHLMNAHLYMYVHFSVLCVSSLTNWKRSFPFSIEWYVLGDLLAGRRCGRSRGHVHALVAVLVLWAFETLHFDWQFLKEDQEWATFRQPATSACEIAHQRQRRNGKDHERQSDCRRCPAPLESSFTISDIYGLHLITVYDLIEHIIDLFWLRVFDWWKRCTKAVKCAHPYKTPRY